MQRSMSYRKPVPEYIPSPPSSPTTVAQSRPATEEDCKPQEENLVEKPVPPLPDNWREILAENVSGASIAEDTSNRDVPMAEKLISDGPAFNKAHVTLRSRSRSTGFIDGDQESFSTVAPSHFTYLRPQRNHGRGLPTTYRPPTPPLRSKQSQDISKKNLKDTEISQIYLPNPYSSYVRVGFPSPGTSSLIRPTPSFRTERTLVSMNTTNMSMGWPSGYPASSERALNHYPIRKPKMDVLLVTDARSRSSDDMGCLVWWSSITKLRNWLKKLRATSH